jgi:tRNA(adenine34) deaminase
MDPTLDLERYMRRAIQLAEQVPELPFGAVLVRGDIGVVVAEGYNRAVENPTWHGEIDALNRCALERPDIDWSSLVLYTTAEPCPMCAAACLWAGVGAIVYGTSIPYLQSLKWWQIDLRAEEVLRRASFRTCQLIGGVLEEECNALFVKAGSRWRTRMA